MITYAAVVLLGLVAVATLAPAWLIRAVNRGRYAARYGSVDLARDALTAWRESRPAAAFERQARRARRQRTTRVLPDVAPLTPTSIDLRGAA